MDIWKCLRRLYNNSRKIHSKTGKLCHKKTENGLVLEGIDMILVIRITSIDVILVIILTDDKEKQGYSILFCFYLLCQGEKLIEEGTANIGMRELKTKTNEGTTKICVFKPQSAIAIGL
jgi:hypothetical protein